LDEEELRSQAYCRTGELIYFWFRKFYARLNTQLIPGLTGNQLFVLVAIGLRGRQTVSELAEDLGVSLSAITGLTSRLVRQGLVVRQRDQDDRRLVFVELTAEGETTAHDFLQQRKKLISRYFDRLPLAEVDQMVATLDKLLVIVQDEDF